MMNVALKSGRSRALWLGFAGLLILMALIAVDSGWSLRDAETTSAAVRLESRARDALMDQLRTDIYQSGTVVRDYLLELDDSRAQAQKTELVQLRARIATTLSAYEKRGPASEQAAFHGLRDHVGTYWRSLTPTLEWDAKERRSDGAAYLKVSILRRRQEVVQLARQVTALNERDLDDAEARLQQVQAQFRRRVTVFSAAALLLGLILAVLSYLRLSRLEQEAAARYVEAAKARQELRKLSDRLVTAQEEERRSLSRELHDEVGQAMSAMLFELVRLQATPPGSEAHGVLLASVRRTAEACVGTVRNMALLLRPSMLDDLGLVPALKWQAREVTRRTGLKIRLAADEIAEDLPDSHRTCVYRVVQEALHNCARHSKATQVRVAVTRSGDELNVCVQDDGVGFDPRQEKGMGLLGMEERVERLNGRFEVESHPGAGTIVSIRLPILKESPTGVKA